MLTPSTSLRAALIAFVALPFVAMGASLDLSAMHGGLGPELFEPVMLVGALMVMLVLQGFLAQPKLERQPSLRTRTAHWGIRNLGTAATLGGSWKRHGLRDGAALPELTKAFARTTSGSDVSEISAPSSPEFSRQISDPGPARPKLERQRSLRTRTAHWGIQNLGTAASLGGSWKRHGLRDAAAWPAPTKAFARKTSDSDASTAAGTSAPSSPALSRQDSKEISVPGSPVHSWSLPPRQTSI